MQRPTWTRRLMGGSWTQTTKQNERCIERERMSDTFNPRQIPRLKYCPNWLLAIVLYSFCAHSKVVTPQSLFFGSLSLIHLTFTVIVGKYKCLPTFKND